jgi:hypothetical protein
MSVDGLKSDITVSNFRKSGRRGTLHLEWSPLEGEAGGFSVATASNTDITVLIVPSSKAFHLKTLVVNNSNAAIATLQLFASDGGGRQKLQITIPAMDTTVIGAGTPGMDFNGAVFNFSYSTAGVYARFLNASTGMQIFAGGQIRDQDNT